MGGRRAAAVTPVVTLLMLFARPSRKAGAPMPSLADCGSKLRLCWLTWLHSSDLAWRRHVPRLTLTPMRMRW